ncbi:MAG: Gfo/Idh/MocA family oxidoreductase [Chloroflexi bacterium]|nr:Gfo/Idh/MocA family oxidoreductase [Chloroflexota bacterium]
MPETINAAVIGLGILGSQHADLLHKRPEVSLTAVADLRRDVAEEVGARLGAAPYTDFREMLRAHRVDLVVVATPDPLHRDPTVAAIEAGVPNIVQEKPLATTWEDAQAIFEAAEKHGARLFVNYANRATPLDISTRYVVQNDLLGRVVYGESRLDDNISVPTSMWGDRTKEWAAGSSTVHFLLPHVVDLLRFYFSPAEVREVFAISQQEVLGYTPDVYDAFLTFDTGMKVRVKAEWIKHIDELVEFYMCFSGAEGTLIYNKRGGFGTAPGWRANVSRSIDEKTLIGHQSALLALGSNVAALLHRPAPSTGTLKAGGGDLVPALEFRGLGYGEFMAMPDHFVDAILQDTLEPTCWQGLGPLPTHIDGLRQTQITAAIVRSAETGQPITLE